MTRYTKVNGKYVIHGHRYDMLEGSRASVYHGTAYKTSGELKKPDLIQNKNGRIVSKRKHNTAKREKRLVKAGYGTKKGKFGYVKLDGSRSRSRSRSSSRSKRHGRRHKKMRGGKGSPLGYEELTGGGTDDADSTYDATTPEEYSTQEGGRKRKRRGGNATANIMNMVKSTISQISPVTPKLH